MAHDIYELLERLELNRENRNTADVLQEVYSLVDEYNVFIKTMDKKFDKVISEMESLLDDGH